MVRGIFWAFDIFRLRNLGIFLLSFISLNAFAQISAQPEQLTAQPRRPRYEIGAAAGAFYLPDYPGANESHLRILPLPYFIYRGDILRADRDSGVRSRFYRLENAEFDLSFDAAFPVNSTDNEARKGMENLDWIGEVGPRFLYHAFKNEKTKIDFYFPIRLVTTTDFTSLQARGVVVNPEIGYRHKFNRPALALAAFAGVTWSSRQLMDYFYTIEGNDITATRPAYQARAGELGKNASAFLVKEFPYQITMFGGASFNFYGDAKNRMSPLLKDRDTVSYSIGLVWRFFESQDREGDTDAYLSRN